MSEGKPAPDWKTMDFDQIYPGRFMKAGDFGGRAVTLTLTCLAMEELEGNKGKQTTRVLTFKETKKQLVLNKTNGLCIRAMFGRKLGAWDGKRITFYPATEGGELCIRVKGSPDIDADITFSLELPRKAARNVTLTKTLPRQPAATSPQPATPQGGAPANANGATRSPGDMNGPPPDAEWGEGRE